MITELIKALVIIGGVLVKATIGSFISYLLVFLLVWLYMIGNILWDFLRGMNRREVKMGDRKIIIRVEFDALEMAYSPMTTLAKNISIIKRDIKKVIKSNSDDVSHFYQGIRITSTIEKVERIFPKPVKAEKHQPIEEDCCPF